MRLRSSRGRSVLPQMPLAVVPGRELAGPGDWPRVFGRAAPLVAEVGFGKDPFLLDRAGATPDQDHVGIERDPARVAAFVAAAARRWLTNVRALPVAAEIALAACFEDASLDELHVYFPDPWPKARHAAHRLVRPWFAREARRILRPAGRLFLATDDAAYARRMREVLVETGSFADVPAGGAQACTKFERLWVARGREIHRLTLVPGEARWTSS